MISHRFNVKHSLNDDVGEIVISDDHGSCVLSPFNETNTTLASLKNSPTFFAFGFATMFSNTSRGASSCDQPARTHCEPEKHCEVNQRMLKYYSNILLRGAFSNEMFSSAPLSMTMALWRCV